MSKVLISDGITSKVISLHEFLNVKVIHCETFYPFLIVGNERFYYNNFLLF